MKLAIPFGVADFAVDAVNTIGNIVLRDPGVSIDDSGNFHYKKGAVNIPKLPKFESEVAQVTRDISAVVAPNIFLAGRALQGARALNAANISRQGLGWQLGSDKAFQWFASTGLSAGVGAGVDYVSEASEEDNLAATLKKPGLGPMVGSLMILLLLILIALTSNETKVSTKESTPDCSVISSKVLPSCLKSDKASKR